MNDSPPKKTTLSDDAYHRCRRLVVDFLGRNQEIRNRHLRELAGITYDQAIHFFNRAVQENCLMRKGKGSGTYYVGGESK